MRILPEEANFAKFLFDVIDVDWNDNDNNFIIPDHCIAMSDSHIVEDIYGNLIREKRYEELANFAIFSAWNLDVKEINRRVVEFFNKTTERTYTSIDSTEWLL